MRLNISTKLLFDIELQRCELAVYFCENDKTFTMEECFKIFCAFLNRFKIAANVNFFIYKVLFDSFKGKSSTSRIARNNATS